MAQDDALQPLRDHPVSAVVEPLARFTGVRRNLVTLAQFVSMAAGKKAMPVNLDIVTDVFAVDNCIADRLCSLDLAAVSRIDTYAQFRKAELNGFENCSILFVRQSHRHLYRDVVGFTTRAIDSCEFAPSVWRVTTQDSDPFLMASSLRVFAQQARRKLRGFAKGYASQPGSPPDREYLRNLLDSLAVRTDYSCSFRERFSASIEPLAMLILERLLQVFANIRRIIDRRSEQVITIQDYGAVRALLVSLPLAPVDRIISAHAIATADRVYQALDDSGHQLSLPDRSGEGHKWFTRADAMRWTEYGYNTVKKHLQELEDDGIVVSTVAENNRDHGRQIHFRFADGRVPPFRWKNPFENLPDLTGVTV